MIAEIGSPTAPPTPRVALMRATAPPIALGCTTSRSTLIASEITPRPMPCSTRPTIMGIRVNDSAEITEPTIMIARSRMRMRRLPYISPRRPLMGVLIAAASSVEVSTHDASAEVVSSSCGSSGITGVTSVCIKATIRPLKASVAMIALSLGRCESRRRWRGVSELSPASSELFDESKTILRVYRLAASCPTAVPTQAPANPSRSSTHAYSKALRCQDS